jgi:hypothetical protein
MTAMTGNDNRDLLPGLTSHEVIVQAIAATRASFAIAAGFPCG